MRCASPVCDVETSSRRAHDATPSMSSPRAACHPPALPPHQTSRPHLRNRIVFGAHTRHAEQGCPPRLAGRFWNGRWGGGDNVRSRAGAPDRGC